MSYQIGIDLGTTYTAAAVHRDENAAIFSLGGRAASIPSVVLLREDETILTGEAAVRRAITEPERVAREFKRRLGDTTPIIVGGSPYSAEALMARLLKTVVAEITAREGGPPSRIAVSHPANWGPYKHDLFRQAVRLAGLDADDVVMLSEPEAAAISYANQERIEEGQIVAVYDLGGGTFDACLLRRTAEGFEIIGKPEGIERLGGIDFDAAVFAHVVRSLDGALSDLDPDDPSVIAAVSRLRADCVDAKEGLSSDTDATIPILLPNLQTEVRLTRREFESLIRPSLVDSIEAMRRAVASAGVDLSQIAKVLLVGGSSRIPLVAQLVSSDLGRPVAVDAHPKHAIAIGAAYAAAAAGGEAQGPGGKAVAPVTPATTSPAPPFPAPSLAASTPAPAPDSQAEHPVPPTPVTPVPVAESVPPPVQAMPPVVAPPPVAAPASAPVSSAPEDGWSDTSDRSWPAASPVGASSTAASGNRLPVLLGIGAVALLAVVGGVIAMTRGGGDTVDAGAGDDGTVEVDPDDSAAGDVTSTTQPEESEVTSTTVSAAEMAAMQSEADAVLADTGLVDVSARIVDGTAVLGGVVGRTANTDLLTKLSNIDGVEAVDPADLTVVDDDEWCSPTVQSEPRWACITTAVWDGSVVTLAYDTENGGEAFNVGGGFHYHFFPDEVEPVNAGTIGGVSEGPLPGSVGWVVHDDPNGFVSPAFAEMPGKYCVRIANSGHALDSLDSGNCWPVEDQS